MTFRTLKSTASRNTNAVRTTSAAVQACHDCRGLKIKCDGDWPKCSTCTTKKRTCGYLGQQGQSRVTAVRSRLESLEKLVAALKTSSLEQLHVILSGVRKDDATGVIEKLASQTVAPGRQFQDYTLLPLINKAIPDLRLLLPEASLVMRAIESFFSCSGKLFQVFPEDHILQCYHTVFDEQQVPSESLMAKVCRLVAVAAAGAQYSPDKISKDTELGMYNLARHFLEVAMEQEPLHAIKVCTLLAQYNIMNKEMISLIYVETGLSMCHMYGINNRALRPDHIPSMEWFNLRKTWRTLTFFSSWLSSTVGYICGNAWSTERRVLSDLKAEDPTNISDVVQAEMARICLLKAEILRMHLAFRDLTTSAVQAIRRDLQDWYEELPEAMRLGVTVHERLPVGTKLSIVLVHILYLGARMLLYRCMATQFLKSCAIGGLSCGLHMHPREAFVQQSADAVQAASTLAGIVKLLRDDDGAFKHCWLVSFQTYISCTILLHSVVQKQLHNFHPSTWQDNLENAKDCLSVLGFYGSQDRVAAQFHEQLEGALQAILAYGLSSMPIEISVDIAVQQKTSDPVGTTTLMEEDREARQWRAELVDHAHLLDIPVQADQSHTRLSFFLLMMLRQPFADPGTKEAAGINLTKHWLADPSRYEYLQMAEPVDWNLESRHMFQWGLSALAAGGSTAKQS